MDIRHTIVIDGDHWELKDKEARAVRNLVEQATQRPQGDFVTISDGVTVVEYLVNSSTRFQYRQEPAPDIQSTFA